MKLTPVGLHNPHPVTLYEHAVLGDGDHRILGTEAYICVNHGCIRIHAVGERFIAGEPIGLRLPIEVSHRHFFKYQRWDYGGYFLNPQTMSPAEYRDDECPYS